MEARLDRIADWLIAVCDRHPVSIFIVLSICWIALCATLSQTI